MTPKQGSVLGGMVAATLGSAAFLHLGFHHLPLPIPVLMAPDDRVLYALAWQVFPALTLMLGVARVAGGRFFSPQAIDGDAPEADSSLDIDRRYVQNTAEQLLLAVVAQLALAVHLDGTQLRLVPLLAVWFVVARLAFWIGYHKSPTARSFGFAATFYPTIGVLLYDAFRMLPS